MPSFLASAVISAGAGGGVPGTRIATFDQSDRPPPAAFVRTA